MLVAKKRSDQYMLPEENDVHKARSRKVLKIGSRIKFAYLSIGFIALAFALMVTLRHAQIASAGYQLIALEKQVQVLIAENNSLQKKVDELKSLENIEYLATTRLGMKKPEMEGAIQFVAAEPSLTETGEKNKVISGNTDTDTEDKKPKKNFLVKALARLINGS